MSIPDIMTVSATGSAPNGAAPAPGTSHDRRDTERISPRLVEVIVATAMLSFLGLLLETVVKVPFPALMSDFGITMSDVSWTTTGYLLVVSIIMSLSGYLQRRFRACSLFAAVALAVALGALVAALAPLLSAAVGGAIGTLASWRAVFWMVLPLVRIALVLGVRCLEQPVPTRRERLSIGQRRGLLWRDGRCGRRPPRHRCECARGLRGAGRSFRGSLDRAARPARPHVHVEPRGLRAVPG